VRHVINRAVSGQRCTSVKYMSRRQMKDIPVECGDASCDSRSWHSTHCADTTPFNWLTSAGITHANSTARVPAAADAERCSVTVIDAACYLLSYSLAHQYHQRRVVALLLLLSACHIFSVFCNSSQLLRRRLTQDSVSRLYVRDSRNTHNGPRRSLHSSALSSVAC